MKKGTILSNILIEKLIFGGKGLATHTDGRKIIISGSAIPQSHADLRVLRSRANHIEAQIIQVTKPSPLERPIPSNWQLYGGCKWLPLPYETQLAIKTQQVQEAFHVLKNSTSETQFHPIIPSQKSEHYRNKVEFSWGKYISHQENIFDQYRFGFHLAGKFDKIENCTYCVLADDEVNAVFHAIDEIARNSSWETYDPKTGQGFWRHCVIRKTANTNEIMIIFSVNSPYSPECKAFFENITSTLTKQFPHIVSMFFLENTGKADIVQGTLFHIFGKTTITEILLDHAFDIQPMSFFQVNTLTAEKLYSTAIDYVNKKSTTNTKKILLDLYAGTGTIGILCAAYFDTVYSVELVASSSEDAIKNAQKNHLTNFIAINQKVEDFAKEFTKEKNTMYSIIVDPPRDGIHPHVLPTLLSFEADHIVYISCNVSTLVRDLALLIAEADYCIADVTPVDMFPHTHHIETVVHLVRKTA